MYIFWKIYEKKFYIIYFVIFQKYFELILKKYIYIYIFVCYSTFIYLYTYFLILFLIL